MVEQQLHHLWNSIQQAYAPDAQAINDIDEFLAAHEWALALEHMEDVVGENPPDYILENITAIRELMS